MLPTKSKEYHRDVWALRRYMLGAQSLSIGVIFSGLIAIRLFIDPTFLGGRNGNGEWFWLWFGFGFILFGVFGIVTTTKKSEAEMMMNYLQST